MSLRVIGGYVNMLERTDFNKKQIVFLFVCKGEKLSFKNDNLVVTEKDGTIKYQVTCYKVFQIFIVGDTSITTGLIRRAKKFGFTICLMTQTFKLYSVIGNRMEGNTLLHKKQYSYQGDELAQFIVHNKLYNQCSALKSIRSKNEACKDAIILLDGYICRLETEILDKKSLLGVEGSAARVYFSQVFNNVNWIGRKPRIKCDFVNAILDIGYSLLFNFVDSLLQVYGFDVYCGIYHKEFYMRKSLVCDMMEPLRPIIDLKVRKAINLGQFKRDDFQIIQNQYCLNYKESAKYVDVLLTEILEHKNDIFIYIRDYYRCFMKEKKVSEYKLFQI